MKKMFGKIYPCIKELKKRWLNKWKVVLNEAAPMLFYKHPECLGLNKYLLLHIKRDKGIKLDMVKDADSIYIATKDVGEPK